jgi:hypothetical protein
VAHPPFDFDWSGTGTRDWAREVEEIYRRHLDIVRSHQANHAREAGESLVGIEREFAIRCNC